MSENMQQPYYKGDGNHSINELQKLCNDFMEFCYQKQLKFQTLTATNDELTSQNKILREALVKCKEQRNKLLPKNVSVSQYWSEIKNETERMDNELNQITKENL